MAKTQNTYGKKASHGTYKQKRHPTSPRVKNKKQ
jgi:hypothetical protein